MLYNTTLYSATVYNTTVYNATVREEGMNISHMCMYETSLCCFGDYFLQR